MGFLDEKRSIKLSDDESETAKSLCGGYVSFIHRQSYSKLTFRQGDWNLSTLHGQHSC